MIIVAFSARLIVAEDVGAGFGAVAPITSPSAARAVMSEPKRSEGMNQAKQERSPSAARG